MSELEAVEGPAVAVEEPAEEIAALEPKLIDVEPKEAPIEVEPVRVAPGEPEKPAKVVESVDSVMASLAEAAAAAAWRPTTLSRQQTLHALLAEIPAAATHFAIVRIPVDPPLAPVESGAASESANTPG